MLEQKNLGKIIDKILQNPILLQKLSDKIYELMAEDLRIQRERSGNYGR